ncbi:MAG: OmpA family protein [Gammaproteobacteria bacterium]|nr:OmpA family protein [Gammaproteobacteria bacterium]
MSRLPARPRKAPAGAPNWIITFADLMTLLLTFFILLLSFSKIDADRYRLLVKSLGDAFGAGWVRAEAVGGTPLTLIESDVVPVAVDPERPAPITEDADATPPAPDNAPEDVINTEQPERIEPGIEELALLLVQTLDKPIAEEQLSVTYDSRKVTIRFSEDATFASGSADLKTEMSPVIDRIVDALARCQGDVIVSGYTDDRPIISNRFRSNWDLSAARAVSVVHELVMNRKIDADRVMAAGHAETNPLAPNSTPEERARNRRVEIKIYNPDCKGGVPGIGIIPPPIQIRP